MNTSNTFTKEHTYITKSILVIMMLIHHLFTSELIAQYSTTLTLPDSTLFTYISTYCKMCISGFAFLTAFGMTHSLKKIQSENATPSYFKTICKRLISLESSVLIIYILAILYKRFIVVESIRELYNTGSGFNILYMLIDMLGLSSYYKTPTINVTWWYLTYAILLIVTMPFIYMAYKKFRYLLLPVGCLLSLIILISTASFSTLLPSVLLGTAFAYEGWFEKIKQSTSVLWKKCVRIFIEIIGIVFSYHLYRAAGLEYCYGFAFLIPLLVFEVISYIPIISSVLKYIGKHATSIFLTHTFVYYYFYTDFIYSFKKDWLILLVMIVICTAISIIIELLKKITGYNLLINKILSRL